MNTVTFTNKTSIRASGALFPSIYMRAPRASFLFIVKSFLSMEIYYHTSDFVTRDVRQWVGFAGSAISAPYISREWSTVEGHLAAYGSSDGYHNGPVLDQFCYSDEVAGAPVTASIATLLCSQPESPIGLGEWEGGVGPPTYAAWHLGA
jgi:hypothetical protein